jgi:hypothetical protein
MEVSRNKTFVLGLGLPKTGTTWFYRYLKLSKNFKSNSIKEQHIWDYRASLSKRLGINRAVYFRARMASFSGEFFKSEFVKYRMRYFPNYYFQYFDQLMKEPSDVTADITPAYWSLDAQTFRDIDSGFERLDIDVKPILILRDPSERFISSVKMKLRRAKIWHNRNVDRENFDAILREFITRDKLLDAPLNKDLEKILEHCINFYGQRLKVVFYEEMFTNSVIKELSEHFNVDYNPHFLQKQINASKKFSEISLETRDLIRQYFGNTYAYFYKHYPKTKTLWTVN